MKIHIHIGRLILEGLPVERNQGPKVQAAVETELARLLAAGGLSREIRAGGAIPSMRAGGMQLTGDRDPARLGRQVAHAVFEGLRQ